MDLELTKLAFSKLPIITEQCGAPTLISTKLSSFAVEGNLAGRLLPLCVTTGREITRNVFEPGAELTL